MSNLAAKMREVSKSTVEVFTKKEVDDAIEHYHLFFIPTIERTAQSGRFAAEFDISPLRRIYTEKIKQLLTADGFHFVHTNNILRVSW